MQSSQLDLRPTATRVLQIKYTPGACDVDQVQLVVGGETSTIVDKHAVNFIAGEEGLLAGQHLLTSKISRLELELSRIDSEKRELQRLLEKEASERLRLETEYHNAQVFIQSQQKDIDELKKDQAILRQANEALQKELQDVSAWKRSKELEAGDLALSAREVARALENRICMQAAGSKTARNCSSRLHDADTTERFGPRRIYCGAQPEQPGAPISAS